MILAGLSVVAAAMTWERLLRDTRWVHPAVKPEMNDVTQRALRASATSPFSYLGAGMTAVVLEDSTGSCFKVGRRNTEQVRYMLEKEAEWLTDAANVPGVSDHTVRVRRFDPNNSVIVRECVSGRPGGWSDEPKLFDLHKKIEKLMIPHGWTSPEFKGDSYVCQNEDYGRCENPILIDASMPIRVGKKLVQYITSVLDGNREPDPGDSVEDLAFYVRRERGDTIDADTADELLARLR